MRKYDMGLTDMSDTVIQEFRERVRAVSRDVLASPAWSRLAEYLRMGAALFVERHGEIVSPLTSAVLKGALLRELKNYEAGQSAPPDPQPQEKTQ